MQNGRLHSHPRQSGALIGTRTRLEAILSPGLYWKRWLIFLVLGIGSAGLGLTLILWDLQVLRSFLRALLMLNWLWGGVLLILGFGLVAYGVWRMNRSMAGVLLEEEEDLDDLELVETLVARQQRRKRRRGPKIVVIGGGTGMPTLLRGLRQYTDNITAVVTVADDGGSSGRLREQMGVLPPGDFRNNIAALSDAEDLMTQLLQYRFGDNTGLSNHNFGNLFITTMTAITGSFETGIAESSRVLAVRGRILPSTLEQVTLCAEIALPAAETDLDEGAPTAQETRLVYVRGESQIPETGGRIVRVHLEPENCRAYPETVQAILSADLIIAAPGSFFTSLLPNLLVPYVRKAICASPAPRLYVCNVATQTGETDGFSVSDHMRHLRLHAGEAFTTVLANDAYDPDAPPAPNADWVTLPPPGETIDYQLFTGDLVDSERPWRHDPDKVAAKVMEIYETLRPRANGVDSLRRRLLHLPK